MAEGRTEQGIRFSWVFSGARAGYEREAGYLNRIERCGRRNKMSFEVNIDFKFDDGANLPPFSFVKSITIPHHVDLERHQKK